MPINHDPKLISRCLLNLRLLLLYLLQPGPCSLSSHPPLLTPSLTHSVCQTALIAPDARRDGRTKLVKRAYKASEASPLSFCPPVSVCPPSQHALFALFSSSACTHSLTHPLRPSDRSDSGKCGRAAAFAFCPSNRPPAVSLSLFFHPLRQIRAGRRGGGF